MVTGDLPGFEPDVSAFVWFRTTAEDPSRKIPCAGLGLISHNASLEMLRLDRNAIMARRALLTKWCCSQVYGLPTRSRLVPGLKASTTA